MSNVLLLLIVGLSSFILIKQHQLEKQMAVDFTALQAASQHLDSVVTSIEALVTNLAEQIRNLPTTDPATQTALNEFAAQLDAKASDIARFTTDNTPAATNPSGSDA